MTIDVEIYKSIILLGGVSVRRKSAVLIIVAVTLLAFPGCLNYAKQAGFGFINTDSNPVPVEQDRVAVAAVSEVTVNKKVYLTFDDGPDYTNTPMILDTLDDYGIKATFFVIGTNIEKHPDILQDIAKRGHALGNHTYSHKYKEIYASSDSFLRSVRTNEELIFRLTGQRPDIVRDPGGAARNNKSLNGLLDRNGYRLVHWNVDSYDSRTVSSEGEDIIENIRLQAQKKHLWPEMIILLHDGKGHMNTVRALPTIIEMLKSQGFKFDVMK